MLPLWFSVVACTVETDPVSEQAPAEPAEKGRKAQSAGDLAARAPREMPEDAVPSFPVPLLGVTSEKGPRAIPGLRPDPATPGDFLIDPKAFAWEGPPLHSGRVRYGKGGLKRAALNATGRARCAALHAQVERLYGPPSVHRCAERQWQTPTHAVRYHERPETAACTVSLLVGDAFDLPPEASPALEAGAWGSATLGAAIASVGGLTPVDGEVAVFRGPSPVPDLPVHGVSYVAVEDRLAEVVVRSTETGCDALKAALVGTFGPGRDIEGGVDWSACDASVAYRFSEDYQACRASMGASALLWQRAESGLGEGSPELREAQAQIARFVLEDAGRLVVTAGVEAWLATHPEFGAAPPLREPVTRNGTPEGYRLSGIGRDSLEFALGLRDRDWIVTLNGQAAEAFQAPQDLTALDVLLRRGGQDKQLQIGFDPGVYAKLAAVRPQFP